MDDRLFELLDDLNITDTKLLLYKDINLTVDSYTRKRIENSIKRKTGYDNKDITIIEKINDILGGIFMKRKIALALGACMILGSGGGAYAYAKTPVAYVSMDINPSVELGVNAFDKVVSVEAYNKDGEKILEGTNLINSNVSDAVSTVISNAISDGYITKDATTTTTAAVAVEITTSTDKENVATKLNESLKEVAEVTLDNNNMDVEVETENVALARRDEARKLGLTPGKLNLIQKLQALDSTIDVEDYKDSSVKEIQKKTKELRKENKVDETTTDSNITSDEVTEENNNSSDNKHNNGNNKKEENSNANKQETTITTTTEKQNNSNNANSQGNNNSLKSENSSNSKSENNSSNSNSSKSENSGNGNSNSQNKDKNKNN
ncbi:hypothetical protein psyc5s11_42150 [Clostridium gelidum]|uniref:Anti-sigma factor RsgI-like middle domain-containing protein n=1 Tax=Clostridium gelidum TaxID=704125 RepID=A0ABM7THQ4_9CLOT|nr:hypothetical protein [Clostridium gelidum]BCZ48148.1 hypothetical protein psyc5s11_42150 [Clostridium gelidum]